MRIALFLLAQLVCAALAMGQTSITLRPTADLPASGDVKLSDIAIVQGPLASTLLAVVMVPEAGAAAARNIDLVGLKQAIDAATTVNWGQVTLHGGVCHLRPASTSLPESKPTAPVVAEPRQSVKPAPQTVTATDAPTVRKLIAERLAALQGVQVEELRIRFEPGPNTALLDGLVETGTRVEVQPGASTSSTRIPIRIDLYRPGQPVQTRTISTEVEVRREVLVTTGPVERDEALTPDLLTVDSRWMPPGAESSPGLDQAIGAVAKRRIDSGRVVTRGDLQPPVVVQRGDVVWVHCFAGSVLIKAKAKAQTSARDGEIVTLQVEGAKKTFTARMAGRGVALMELPSAVPTAFAPADAVPGARPLGRDGSSERPATLARQLTAAPAMLPAPVEPKAPATVVQRSKQSRLLQNKDSK